MFLGPHKMEMSHFYSVFDTLWNLGLFWFLKTPPPLILNYSHLKLVTLWFFDPPPSWTNSQVSLLFRLESFPKVRTISWCSTHLCNPGPIHPVNLYYCQAQLQLNWTGLKPSLIPQFSTAQPPTMAQVQSKIAQKAKFFFFFKMNLILLFLHTSQWIDKR